MPPSTSHTPSRSTCATSISVAGARNGEEPQYVEYRPNNCRSRGSAKCWLSAFHSVSNGRMPQSARAPASRTSEPMLGRAPRMNGFSSVA